MSSTLARHPSKHATHPNHTTHASKPPTPSTLGRQSCKLATQASTTPTYNATHATPSAMSSTLVRHPCYPRLHEQHTISQIRLKVSSSTDLPLSKNYDLHQGTIVSLCFTLLKMWDVYMNVIMNIIKYNSKLSYASKTG